MSQSGTVSIKSYQMFTINDQLLAKVVAATKQADSLARSKGTIQSLELFHEGHRQHLVIGRLMIIPAKVADNREDFPLALLYGALVREFAGEDIADLMTHKIGDTEFDEYSTADFLTIKDKLFKNPTTGRYESLVVFLPSWSNPRDYVSFKMTKDDAALAQMLRHLIFAAYYNPAVSSAFDLIMTDVSTDQLDVTDISPKLTQPFLTANPFKSFPDLEYGDGNPAKTAGAKKPYACITRHTAAELAGGDLETGEKDVLAALTSDIEAKKAADPLGMHPSDHKFEPHRKTPVRCKWCGAGKDQHPEVGKKQDAKKSASIPGVVDTPSTTKIEDVAKTSIEGESLRRQPDYGEKGSFTSEINEENSKAAAARPKITARKYEGDDKHSWAVFRSDKSTPMYTGLGKSELEHYKRLAGDILAKEFPKSSKYNKIWCPDCDGIAQDTPCKRCNGTGRIEKTSSEDKYDDKCKCSHRRAGHGENGCSDCECKGYTKPKVLLHTDMKKADMSPGGAWTTGNGTMLKTPAVQGDDAAVAHLKTMEVETFEDPTSENKTASSVWGTTHNEQGQHAVSARSLAAREIQEAKLAKLRANSGHAAASAKVADVEMTFDGIWGDITEDMGPAPLVDLKEPTKKKETKSEAPKTEESSQSEEPKKEEPSKSDDSDPTPPTPPARKSVRTPKEEKKEETDTKVETKESESEKKEAEAKTSALETCNKHGHKWKKTEVDKKTVYKCSDCGESKAVTIPEKVGKKSVISFIVQAEDNGQEYDQAPHPDTVGAALSAVPEVLGVLAADRRDDVPVVDSPEVEEKQPVSDLSGAAPIASDLPPQLASKNDPEHEYEPNAAGMCNVCGCGKGGSKHKTAAEKGQCDNPNHVSSTKEHGGGLKLHTKRQGCINWMPEKTGSKDDPKHQFESNKAGLCNSCGCSETAGNHKTSKKAGLGDEVNGHSIACFAGKDESEWDRYTVVYLDQPERDGMYACVGLSGHSAAQLGPHLGTEVPFAQIPAQLQKIVQDDLADEYFDENDPTDIESTYVTDKQRGQATHYSARRRAAFSYAAPGIPGQVIEEFYPELQGQIVDAPNYSNDGMAASPEVYGDGAPGAWEGFGPESDGAIPDNSVGYVSTAPGVVGLGISAQPEVLDGSPLRSENDIRGYGFMDEFYQQQGQAIPGSLLVASLYPKKGSKTAGDDKDHCLDQFDRFLKLVVGEIAATMISAFKVTNRLIMDQVPGVGTVQLAEVERAAIAANASFNTVDTASRVHYLLDQLNDNEIQKAINSAYAQASVWHDKPEGGYVFEVFVRAESIDTDTAVLKYKFVCGTKGLD